MNDPFMADWSWPVPPGAPSRAETMPGALFWWPMFGWKPGEKLEQYWDDGANASAKVAKVPKWSVPRHWPFNAEHVQQQLLCTHRMAVLPEGFPQPDELPGCGGGGASLFLYEGRPMAIAGGGGGDFPVLKASTG